MSVEIDCPHYAPRSVCWLAWYTPEIGASSVLGAVGLTVAAPIAPYAALPLLVLLGRETVRRVRNRRVIAAHWRRIREQDEQLEPAPLDDPAPEPIRATAVRLDVAPIELESGR